MAVTLVKIDKNGTKYYHDSACTKCGGKGYIPGYEHVFGAVCFQCNGSGFDGRGRSWKEYTPEYAAKLEERRRARLIAKVPEMNEKTFNSNGFNSDGKTYVVLGETYPIKEQLKADGAKFNEKLGWYFTCPNDKYSTIQISIEQIADKDEIGRWSLFDIWEVKEIIKQIKDENAPKTKSEYVGNIGDKIEIDVKLVKRSSFKTHFTYYGEINYIYKFEDENENVFIWKTSSFLEIEEGESCKLIGKIKEHSEYKNTKQTVLTRCKIKSSH